MATRGSIFNGFFELPSQILERIIGARKKHDYQFNKPGTAQVGAISKAQK